MNLFDCDCCGVCCKNIRLSIFYTEELDRGDGVCKHFNETTHLCKIYAERPLFCNIDAYYDKYLSEKMSREEFHELNHAACDRLKNFNSSTEALQRYDELLTVIESIHCKKFDSAS